MKRLAIKLLFFLPLVLTMAVVNYLVDPAQLFSDAKYVRGIAELMVAGQNVEGLSSFDDVGMREMYPTLLNERKEILVLGSSRCMQIGSELFPGCTFHNAWTAGGTLQTVVRIHRAYDRANKLPDLVILGCDPWLFNDKLVRPDEIDLAPQRSRSSHWDQLLSPSYFQASLQRLWRGRLFDYCSTREDKHPSSSIYLADGSRMDPTSLTECDPSIVNAELRKGLSGCKPYVDFAQLSRPLQKRFEALLDEMAAKNIKVVFWLAPFHPIWHDAYFSRAEYGQIARAESYFREIGQQRGIPVIGSYAPERCGVVGVDMTDGTHLKRQAIRRLFEAALARPEMANLLPDHPQQARR